MFSSNSQASQAQGAGRPAPSIISTDVTITGILQSQGDMQVDGKVDGNVRGHKLVIGEEAEIRGEIEADTVTVRGKVEGAIRARTITLAAGCHVEGDIVHETLEMEFGAFLQGQVRHCVNPLADLLPLLDGNAAVDLERRRPGSPMRNVQPEAELPAKIAVNG